MEGGKGAAELAQAAVELIENSPSQPIRFTYADEDSPRTKIIKVARSIYGAGEITFSSAAEKKLKQISEWKYDRLPVCIAKTQYSFSGNPKQYGAVKDFELKISDIEINAGAGFIVALVGEMMRMPGLPKVPQANHIRIVDGEIEGLN